MTNEQVTTINHKACTLYLKALTDLQDEIATCKESALTWLHETDAEKLVHNHQVDRYKDSLRALASILQDKIDLQGAYVTSLIDGTREIQYYPSKED